MANKGIGIYVGKNFVDVAAVTGAINKPFLVDHIREDITLPQNEQVPSSDQKQRAKIVAAIKSSIGKLKISSDIVYSVLSEEGVMIRHFDMPLLPKSEQGQAINFEARKYVPFKIENIYSDFRVIDTNREHKTMRVFFVAAQKADVESELKLFSDAGLKTGIMDIVPFALLRVINQNKRFFKEKDTIALLQLSVAEDVASISIIEENCPTINRGIAIPKDKDALIEKLVSEMRLSFDYYKRKPASKEIKKLIICAKEDASDLRKKLAEDLNMAIETVDFSKVIKGEKVHSLGAIIAAGAAMVGLGKDVYSVNILPPKTRVREFKLSRQLFVAAGIAAALILLTLFYSIGTVISAKTRLNAVMDKARTLPAQTGNLGIDGLLQLKDKETKTIEFLKSLITKKIFLTDKLNRIAADLPQGVWINMVRAENLFEAEITMLLKGKAFFQEGTNQIDAVNKFLETLKQDKLFMQGFSSCKLGDIRKENVSSYNTASYEVTNYTIQCGGEK
ncbi:MAG: pilus assembly protein PilM [Candidatus Omnitrophota bacterium]